EQAVMVNLYRVTQSLLAGRISEKTAGLALWSIAIGAPAATRISPQRTRRAQRKNENRLPQIHGKPGLVNADGRRSERKFSRESRHPRQAGAGAGTRLTRTQGCASRNLDGSTPCNPGASLTMTSRSAAKSVRRDAGNSGVTRCKSFKSGVAPRTTPSAKLGNSGSRENSLKRHRHDRHSRDLSTPPHVADASSESLKMTMGERHRHSSERGNVSTGCDLKTTTDNHTGHEGAQRSHTEGEHSSVSPCLR